MIISGKDATTASGCKDVSRHAFDETHQCCLPRLSGNLASWDCFPINKVLNTRLVHFLFG